MEAFVGEPPPVGVDAIDHYFAWDEERLRRGEAAPQPPRSQDGSTTSNPNWIASVALSESSRTVAP